MTDKKEIIVQESKEVQIDMAKAFIESLIRNNAKIRQDRADAICEDAEVTYRRAVEDIELNIKRLTRERENMLDLAPDHAMSLQLAVDFNAKEFTAKDIEIGIKIRNEEIRLEIAKKRYNYLFGGM